VVAGSYSKDGERLWQSNWVIRSCFQQRMGLANMKALSIPRSHRAQSEVTGTADHFGNLIYMRSWVRKHDESVFVALSRLLCAGFKTYSLPKDTGLFDR
jgi:hypothetical protein